MSSTQRKSTANILRTPQRTTEPPKARNRPQGKQDGHTTDVRNHLAILMTSLLAILALVAAVQIGALPVIQLLLPLVGTIFGFYFGYRAGKTHQ
jgi:hypothetical protein